MAWDTSELRRRFSKPVNSDAIRFLTSQHPSAHSDVTDELFRAAGPDGVGRSFCPDRRSYAYFLLHTGRDIIYAIAAGMSQIVFRLPARSIARARLDGGEADLLIGPHWNAFRIFRPNTDVSVERGRLKHWCGIAARHADDIANESSLAHAP